MPSWLTKHFTFIKLFLPVFSLMKKLFNILQVRNLNFFCLWNSLKSYGFWKIKRNWQWFLHSCSLSYLFLNILLVHIRITKTLKVNLSLFDFNWFLKKNNTEFYFCTLNISLYNFILINGNFLHFNTFNCLKSKTQVFLFWLVWKLSDRILLLSYVSGNGHADKT